MIVCVFVCLRIWSILFLCVFVFLCVCKFVCFRLLCCLRVYVGAMCACVVVY